MDIASFRHDHVSCCFFGPEGVNQVFIFYKCNSQSFYCLQSHCKRSRWTQLVPLKHPNLYSILYVVTLPKAIVQTLISVELQNANMLFTLFSRICVSVVRPPIYIFKNPIKDNNNLHPHTIKNRGRSPSLVISSSNRTKMRKRCVNSSKAASLI